METVKARRPWIDVLEVINDHRSLPTLLYPVKLLVMIEDERKILHNKEKLKAYMNTKPGL